jgi:hypothetical protein
VEVEELEVKEATLVIKGARSEYEAFSSILL